jgi:hypothetical protein
VPPSPCKFFSNHWKTPENFFQSLEKLADFFQPLEKNFPIIGKLFRWPRGGRREAGGPAGGVLRVAGRAKVEGFGRAKGEGFWKDFRCGGMS